MSRKTLRILHLEDDPADAFLVRRTIVNSGLVTSLTLVQSRQEFLAALEQGPWDIVVADNALPTFSSTQALDLVRQRHPSTPFIVLSGAGTEDQIINRLQEGAADYILKDHLPQLIVSILRLSLSAGPGDAATPA